MRHRRRVYQWLLVVLAAATSLDVGAQQSSTGAQAWWSGVVGFIAILACMVGLIYSYLLTNKIRVVSRKLELELLEGEGPRPQGEDRIPNLVEIVASPRAAMTRALNFLTRFIVLYLVLIAWGLIARLLGPFFLGGWLDLLAQSVPWIAAILIGVPLFVDIAGTLGSTLRGLRRDSSGR